ncbi:MAG: GntR family transcriptional regulator [Confluentimicrobium sp.]|jgi:DNA-binding FadR family transcriptional regulator|uniref:FadR/GntR family transcriptional regulator n=1 Tax=Actibacterium sp. TaxID=1872125 RepID=UPI000C35FDCB|nr:FCD domain-containing protein [Actibacterium sp.]MBC56622.1 GntR family transcriptional regulator [Actibacterium sp.]MDY6860180.1 FCD domain-containing protein [Pseudomonadota bacterium]|tara:strand:- start:2508 stop:3218 length:711 start_codon:yes stop_codon:yes gene_type:complete
MTDEDETSGPRADRGPDDTHDGLLAHLREQLAQNAQLPPERTLSERLDVSRHTLRKALKVLRASGELDPAKSGRRAASEKASSSARLVQSTNPIEVMEMRMMIEPALARLAALRASPDEIARILQTAQSPAGQSPSQADQEFHRAVAAGSRNSLASELHILLHRVQNDARLRFTDSDTDSRTTEERVRIRDTEHRNIAEAIAARDPDRAEAAMYDHLDRTQRKLTGRLGQRPNDAA